MKVTRICFTAEEFTTLPIEERLFFVQLAHAHNDLRHIQQLVVRAIGATRKYEGVEREIASHQMLYGVRQWYAALNEGWKIVRTCWGSDALGKKFYPKLSIGKEPYDFLKRYFSHTSLVNTIRDRFVYHYDSDHLVRLLGELPPDAEQHFVSTQYSGNIFYNAAENIQNLALIATAGEVLGFTEATSWSEEVARQSIRKLYDEVCRISEKFNEFCNDVLRLIVRQCPLQSRTLTSTAVSDLQSADLSFLSMKKPSFAAVSTRRNCGRRSAACIVCRLSPARIAPQLYRRARFGRRVHMKTYGAASSGPEQRALEGVSLESRRRCLLTLRELLIG
jgi:hypothetical protein